MTLRSRRDLRRHWGIRLQRHWWLCLHSGCLFLHLSELSFLVSSFGSSACSRLWGQRWNQIFSFTNSKHYSCSTLFIHDALEYELDMTLYTYIRPESKPWNEQCGNQQHSTALNYSSIARHITTRLVGNDRSGQGIDIAKGKVRPVISRDPCFLAVCLGDLRFMKLERGIVVLC